LIKCGRLKKRLSFGHFLIKIIKAPRPARTSSKRGARNLHFIGITINTANAANNQNGGHGADNTGEAGRRRL
jgi:hypothetical protein